MLSKMPFAILVTGSRDWKDYDSIFNSLSIYPSDSSTVLIHGGCRGLDTIASKVAHDLNFSVEQYSARWNIYGYSAGPVRNKSMLKRLIEYKDQGYTVKVLAFHPNLSESKGTKNCYDMAVAQGFEVKLYTE